MERMTDACWRNFDPWECCGQDYFCKRGCHDEGGCTNGCIVPKLYCRFAAYEDTGVMPEEVTQIKLALEGKFLAEIKEFDGIPADRVIELLQAEKDGRLVVLPPNDPLTLEELREMDGEPIWVVFERMNVNPSWYIVNTKCEEAANKNGGFVSMVYYGYTWLAYRRKPEEV